MASTHFEPIGARLAFPCYDEPKLKANFQLKITHNIKYRTVLSNMPLDTTVLDKNNLTQMTTIFRPTPKMSTYLLAFVIADFDPLYGIDQNFQLWARREVLKNGQYAINIGQKQLDALGNYTNIKYEDLGIPQMKSVAVPELSPGAMENWGLVIYR